MKKWNSVFGKVVMCVCEITAGVLLLLNPLGFTTGIIKVAGVLLSVAGIFSIYKYFRTEPFEAHKEQGLVKGISGILSGLFCVFNTKWFILTFPLMTVVYGIIILFTGILRVQWAVDMLRMKNGKWQMAAGGAAVSLVLSGIILLNPFATTAVLWTFVAVSLITGAVIDLVVLVFINQHLNNGGNGNGKDFV